MPYVNFQNGNLSDPYCTGIDGVMEAYNKALHSSQLYGPTNFAPCINHVSRQVFVISLCILSYL